VSLRNCSRKNVVKKGNTSVFGEMGLEDSLSPSEIAGSGGVPTDGKQEGESPR